LLAFHTDLTLFPVVWV